MTNKIRKILNIRDVFNKYYVPCLTLLIVFSNPKIKIKQLSNNYYRACEFVPFILL